MFVHDKGIVFKNLNSAIPRLWKSKYLKPKTTTSLWMSLYTKQIGVCIHVCPDLHNICALTGIWLGHMLIPIEYVRVRRPILWMGTFCYIEHHQWTVNSVECSTLCHLANHTLHIEKYLLWLAVRKTPEGCFLFYFNTVLNTGIVWLQNFHYYLALGHLCWHLEDIEHRYPALMFHLSSPHSTIIVFFKVITVYVTWVQTWI